MAIGNNLINMIDHVTLWQFFSYVDARRLSVFLKDKDRQPFLQQGESA